jgi:phage tail protein X
MLYSVRSEGEMLDMICVKHYGETANYLESVLAANPSLARLPEILPLNTVIFLPEIKQPNVKKSKSLWD